MTNSRSQLDLLCVALIGMRGSGKTTVGQQLACLLGGDFVDTDDLVVTAAGRSIAQIFATDGAEVFRRYEAQAVARAAKQQPRVISVGGGAVLDEKNVEVLSDVAMIVWLAAGPEVLWQRVRDDSTPRHERPALTDQSGLADMEQLLAERRATYEQAADLIVDTTDRTPAEVAEDIASQIA